MTVVEQIQKKVTLLSQPLQREVLDFVEFLAARASAEQARRDEVEFARDALAHEWRRLDELEGEIAPLYTLSDIREPYH